MMKAFLLAYLLEILLFVVAVVAHLTGRPRTGFITLSVALASVWLRAERDRRSKEALLRELAEMTALLRRAWLIWR